MFIDEKYDPSVSTFRPLPQQINSNIKENQDWDLQYNSPQNCEECAQIFGTFLCENKLPNDPRPNLPIQFLEFPKSTLKDHFPKAQLNLQIYLWPNHDKRKNHFFAATALNCI